MKKWIAVLLSLALMAGVLPAALATETNSPVELKVGFGRANATPSEADRSSIHLAGSTNVASRTAKGGLATPDDALNMTAIALSDGSYTSIVMTTDFIRVPTKWTEEVQSAVDKLNLKVPVDHITISATHTHSAPDIGDDKYHPSYDNNDHTAYYFNNYWLLKAVEAIEVALNDLTTVSETQIGRVNIPNMTWVRHWSYSDGTMNGTHFESTGGNKVRHPRDADDEMQLIRFVRDDREDVVLVNWQSHPTGCSGAHPYSLSADYCGVLCRYLESQDPDCFAAFFQGAAGNLASFDQLDPDANNKKTEYEEYGNTLGECALAALNNEEVMEVVETGAVKSLRNENTVVKRGYTTTLTVQQDVITVGNSIAFVSAGYEMFDSNGKYVKEESPYDMTFVIENTQSHEYMPDWQTCHYPLLGGPEAYEAGSTQFNMVPGTAEDLADCLVSMLDILYKS